MLFFNKKSSNKVLDSKKIMKQISKSLKGKTLTDYIEIDLIPIYSYSKIKKIIYDEPTKVKTESGQEKIILKITLVLSQSVSTWAIERDIRSFLEKSLNYELHIKSLENKDKNFIFTIEVF